MSSYFSNTGIRLQAYFYIINYYLFSIPFPDVLTFLFCRIFILYPLSPTFLISLWNYYCAFTKAVIRIFANSSMGFYFLFFPWTCHKMMTDSSGNILKQTRKLNISKRSLFLSNAKCCDRIIDFPSRGTNLGQWWSYSIHSTIHSIMIFQRKTTFKCGAQQPSCRGPQYPFECSTRIIILLIIIPCIHNAPNDALSANKIRMP